jgi:hypothetical protein
VNYFDPVLENETEKEHSREANLSQISILLENSMVSREQALPVARQAEINNEIPLSVSPPENDNATSDLGNNKSETQSIEQFKPTTITAATTNAIHTKGEKNRAGQNKTIRNKGKFGNKVNNDNDNSSTHSLKPKQKGEIKINKTRLLLLTTIAKFYKLHQLIKTDPKIIKRN